MIKIRVEAESVKELDKGEEWVSPMVTYLTSKQRATQLMSWK